MLGLKPIKTLPIREKIAATLREAILSRKIPAGEVLTLGKYSTGTGGIYHTGAGSLSDPRKGWPFGIKTE